MNVLFIIYDLERGGPEMRLLNLARHLPSDIRMHLCVTSNNLAMLDDFTACGVPVTVIPISKPWFEPGKIRTIARYCFEHSIDIVNVFDIKGLIVAGFLKISGSGIPVLFHHVGSFEALSRRRYLFLRFMLGRADYFVCNNEFSRGELHSLVTTERIFVVHNGIDTDRFALDREIRIQTRSYLKVDDNCILLGIVANLRPEKNPQLLVDGFSQLAGRHANVKLLIVGGGSLLEWTKGRVAESGLSGRVIFTGYTSEVTTFMQAMDIMVLTSISEGFPTVLIEGMAMGMPVVTSDAGGCSEIVNHGVTGLIFKSGDTGGFVAAAGSLVSDAPLAREIAERGHEQVHSRFTMKRMVERYADHFRKIAGGGC